MVHSINRPTFFCLMALGIALLAAACGGETTPTPTTPPTPDLPVANATPTAAGSDADQGRALFAAKGCSVCHGEDGDGTGAGPALAGHSDEQVRRQVRNPVGGRMPQYDTDRISDAELREIIAFVNSLDDDGGHGHHTELPPAELALMHVRMALVAIKTTNAQEAAHHLGHVLEHAEQEIVRLRTEEALEALEAGELHEAEHELEELAGEHGGPGETLAALHLQLALTAIEAGDAGDVRHHVDHYIELGPAAGLLSLAQDALGHLSTGALEDAEHAIEDIVSGDGEHHDDD